MNLSIAIGSPLTPSSERNILNHSRILDIVAPKAGRVGPEEAERKTQRTSSSLSKSGFQVSKFLGL